MPLCSNTWCLREGELAEIDGKKLCRICAITNESSKRIEKLYKKEELKKEIVARCSKCLSSVYNVDPPRKFHKNFGFEYIFNSSEIEEIILCKVCYQKKLTDQKIKKIILSICLIILLCLWISLFYWETISKLWSEHPTKLTFFVITIIFAFFIFNSFDSILLVLSKIRKRIKKMWEHVKNSFVKKEILIFQSQEDKNFSWFAEIYIDKKVGFCFICQGGDKLDKDKTKGRLFLTLKVIKKKLGNKSAEENIVNSFCRGCSKKKIEELRNNPTLKNPERLKDIDRELN